jgi:hypothetical protein
MPDDASFVDLGFARVDLDRRRRTGFPEVIFGPRQNSSRGRAHCAGHSRTGIGSARDARFAGAIRIRAGGISSGDFS